MEKAVSVTSPASKWPKNGREAVFSNNNFLKTSFNFTETSFACGLQDDLIMVAWLVQLALLCGIVDGKAVWDTTCRNILFILF